MTITLMRAAVYIVGIIFYSTTFIINVRKVWKSRNMNDVATLDNGIQGSIIAVLGTLLLTIVTYAF